MGANHQGLAARIFDTGYIEPFDLLQYPNFSKLQLILALDQVQDPGNIGALARTLFALGGIGMVITRHRSASLGSAAIKSSAGALNRLSVARVANLSKFLDQAGDFGWNIYGTGLDDTGHNIYLFPEFEWPMILILGNEEKGIRPGVAKRCKAILSIPMCSGFNSLNVAQAGAMIMGEFSGRWFRNT